MSDLPGGPGAPPLPAVCLVILDGWGLAEDGPGNAVSLASTPVFDSLWEKYPHTQLTAWGREVGLPEGQMGNSEVGHLNLGAGAIVRQDLTRIDDAVADGSLGRNDALRAVLEAGREAGRLHLLGLVSDGGVHASLDHLRALIGLASEAGVPDIVLHAFTDGRDTLPDSGADFVEQAEGWLEAAGGRIGSVTGRYFAMDRDKRWDRVKLAWDAIVHGRGDAPDAATGVEAVRAAYERDETDEFVKATVVGEEARIRSGDAVLFFNFRPDRARELTRALGEQDFDEFDRGPDPPEVALTTLTQYQEDWTYPVAFPPDRPSVTLASHLASLGKSQLHVAETEKYAHVTYFFNGGVEHEYSGEERALVDSPRDVATYDEKPEMSAHEAASAFTSRWEDGDYAFGIINFANPDMVGHTGVIEAAVKALEAVDECLGQVVRAVHERGGACIVTADHGNCDHMLEDDGSPNTAHSMNPVPLIVTAGVPGLREGGILADVAPTVLALLGVDQPEEMTGESLVEAQG
ncbi:MAG: 2,3-bisphosphoglycerate-independent phosphoglycerate mutase [Thermoleophilaceae bacterium]|nr:2,3-bisphosphoglycerate-independent phosphoglycerate mutase [Thermoleophilaceae bacterium]